MAFKLSGRGISAVSSSIERSTVAALVLLAVLSLLPYLNTLVNGFVWDDGQLIVDNSAIKNWKHLPRILASEDAVVIPTGFYRPLTQISFLIDHSVWGLNPFGFHLTNVLLHIAVVLLIYWNFKDLYSRRAAFLASVLFASHPALTEPVNFLSGGRNTLLCVVFMLTSFLFYQKFRQSGKTSYAVAALSAFFLSALSKEFAFTLPLIILGYEFSFSGKRLTAKNSLKVIAPFLGVILVYGLLKLWAIGQLVQASPPGPPAGDRLAQMGGVFFTYVRLLALPWNVRLYYDEGPQQVVFNVLGAALAAGALLCLAWAGRREKKIFFALLWFLVPLLPVANIIPMGGTPAAVRFLYASTIGYALLLSLFLLWLRTKIRGRLFVPVLPALLIFYGASTVYRNFDWKNDFTLFSRELTVNPGSGRAAVSIASWHIREREPEKAEKILTSAYRTSGYQGVPYALGDYYLDHKNDPIKALGYYLDAMGHERGSFPPYIGYNKVGKAHEQAGDYAAARNAYEKGIELNPSFSVNYTDMGILFFKQGMLAQSEAYLQKALSINPVDAYAHNALGAALRERGDDAAAAVRFRTAIELSPKFCEARYNLGLAVEKIDERQAREIWRQYIDACKNEPGERDFISQLEVRLSGEQRE